MHLLALGTGRARQREQVPGGHEKVSILLEIQVGKMTATQAAFYLWINIIEKQNF